MDSFSSNDVFSTVPQEIMDAIIFEVHHHHNALLQCSLVSQTFVHPCRTWIFHTIVLSSSKSCKGLHGLLTTNPTLAYSIREFELNAFYSTSSDYKWIIREQSLPSLLSMLSSVESFTMDPDPFLDWDDIPAKFTCSLANFLQFDTLVCISLSSMRNVPAALFTRFAQLKRLRLRDVSLTRQPFDMPAPSTTSIKGQLEILEYSCVYDTSEIESCLLVEALKHPESSLGISSLKELVCEIGKGIESNIRMMSMITQEAASSLEGWSILHLKSPEPYPNMQSLKVGLTGNLRFFVFCSKWIGNDQLSKAPLRWAINELKRMARTSCLKHVILVIDMGGIHQIKWEHWKNLDGALKGSSDAHRDLEEVSLVLCMSDAENIGELNGIAPLVEKQMPLSLAAGCLTVSVSTRPPTTVYNEKRRQLSHLIPPSWT